MPVLTALYVDFVDPYSHRAWGWLSALPECDAVQVRPYLADADEGEHGRPHDRPVWDRHTPSLALELLALGELARDAGTVAHRAFVDAAFTALHVRGLDLGRPEAWLVLATETGLDLGVFALEGERLRAEVGLWHAEAQDELGVSAVPSLVFDDGSGLLLRLDAPVEAVAPARLLLRALVDLAGLPVAEVRAAG